jgi:hypothetical protein
MKHTREFGIIVSGKNHYLNLHIKRSYPNKIHCVIPA